MKTICIYHKNCADGFGAAWAVKKAITNAGFFAASYQELPPDVKGKNVIIVDFSYKRPVLLDLAREADQILILDHHKSAAEDLINLPDNVTAVFDMNRSGAMMAWQHFFPDKKPPRLIEHIQDRDLWRFEIPGTREIQACLFSYPYDFGVWDTLMTSDIQDLQRDGAAIDRKHQKDIRELLDATKHRMIIGGFNVPVANLPYTMASDAAHIMADGEPFAACYWDVPGGRMYSLRSRDCGVDVSAIAKRYGGGGHEHAAGFRKRM